MCADSIIVACELARFGAKTRVRFAQMAGAGVVDEAAAAAAAVSYD